jgi:hypothetical protein
MMYLFKENEFFNIYVTVKQNPPSYQWVLFYGYGISIYISLNQSLNQIIKSISMIVF